MKNKIFILILLIFLLPNVFAELRNVFVLDLFYDKGNISEKGIYAAPVYYNVEKNQPENSYYLIMNSLDNEEIFRENFDFDLYVYDEGFYKDEAEKRILIPYDKNAENIEIYDNKNKLLLKIDVRQLTENVCGDGTCDSNENFSSCSMDCWEKTTERKFYVYIIAAVLVLLAVILVIYFVKKKTESAMFK